MGKDSSNKMEEVEEDAGFVEGYKRRIEEAFFRSFERKPLRERLKHDPTALRGAPEVKELGKQLAFFLKADYDLGRSAFDGAAKKLLVETGGDLEGLKRALGKMTGDYSNLESPYQLVPRILTQYARRKKTMAEVIEELKEAAKRRGEADWVEAGFVKGKPRDALSGETVEEYRRRIREEAEFE